MSARRMVWTTAGMFALSLPLLAAAQRTHGSPPPPPAANSGYGVRVLARAETGSATMAPEPSPTASPTPGPSPALVNAGRAEFEAWQNGKIDLGRYIPEAKLQFTDAAVSEISAQNLRPLGPLKTFTFVRQMAVQGMTVHVFRAACANGTLDELISWNVAGKVQLISFRPSP